MGNLGMFKRYGVFFLGITIVALGVALTTKASLGTTPISALPYVASLGFQPSLGFFNLVLNLSLVAGQVAILRERFPRIQYLQIPISFVFAFFIDFWMYLIPGLHTEAYAYKLLALGLGTLALACGVFLEVSANVVMMAGEGAVKALAMTLQKDFGTLKTGFDITLVVLGALLSIILFSEIRGIGEGTVLSAVFVGVCVKCLHALRRRFA